MKKLFILILCAFSVLSLYSQCCSVGGGSPLAGDASVGVLQGRQFEISSNFQYVSSKNFLTENKPDTSFLESYNSKYLYTRLAFGLSERLTMSIETGYWLDKTQIGLREADTYSSSGIGDLILLPRYNVIQAGGHNRFKELTVGLGFKIPLGSYNDSLGILEPFSGETFYITKPLAVQATSGSHDLIFSLFYTGLIPGAGLKLSANALYIKKGWNPLGEKLGDYASFGLFVSRSFVDHLNVSVQLKGEWIGKMEINPDMLMVRFISYDPEATGSTKYFLSPQLSYLFANRLTAFFQGEFPIYQHVNKTQIASQTQMTFGLTYRFLLSKQKEINPTSVL